MIVMNKEIYEDLFKRGVRMSYEESKLFSLLKKQDIDSLFLEATNYLCQTKSLFEEKERLQQENQQLKIQVSAIEEEYKKLEDKLSKIETLIINHNCDTGDIYYKYNSRFLKSELKERILEIVYEKGSNSNE